MIENDARDVGDDAAAGIVAATPNVAHVASNVVVASITVDSRSNRVRAALSNRNNRSR